MRILKLFSFLIISIFIFFLFPVLTKAIEPGTLLYRSSSEGKIYGLNAENLIESKNGLVSKINSGHVAIYIGQEKGVHYVVEALADGIVKTPAHYFINRSENEVFLGAKIPKKSSAFQRARAVAIAKSLAQKQLDYDFNFSRQKGPMSGQWTCVGLAEKIYESANSLNPKRLSALEYDTNDYAVDITRDGFDDFSYYNSSKDVFSTKYEFSKISRVRDTILPAPEILGYNAGKEKNGNRYIFLPYTQFLQETLKSVDVDINLESEFKSSDIRGKTPSLRLVLSWSLVNNPISTVKEAGRRIVSWFKGPEKKDAIVLSDIESDRELQESNHNLAYWLDNNNQSDIDFSYSPTEINGSLVDKNSEEEINSTEKNITLLISMIGSDGVNDWLEIYNYGSKPIDLEEENIRLEKAVTADNPSIVLRFDSQSDGTYPGSRIIEPHSSYLIVREQADSELLKQADAIGFRSNFTWTGSGYTLYLATGAVRNDQDERIIDKVGWGEARFYFGNQAAPAIEENTALRRKAKADTKIEDILKNGEHYNLAPIYNSQDNYSDFLLWPMSGQEVEESEEVNISSQKEEEKSEENNINEEEDASQTEEDDNEEKNQENNDEEEKESAEENNEEEEEKSVEEEDFEITLLISQIGTDGFNDYLEIYNYGEDDIDLAKEEIRISKAYQSDNFSIVLRFSESDDYSGESIISANSSLMIIRERASEELKEDADVVGLRAGFSWSGDGYTLFLSDGPVRSGDDERIIDKVGWGKARFYQGTPADEIEPLHILKRKALVSSKVKDLLEGGDHFNLAPKYNSFHNGFDFLLLPLSEDEENEEEEEDESVEENNEEEEKEEDVEENNDEEDNEEKNGEEEEGVEENNEEEEEIVEEEEIEITLLISQIGTDGFNDYLEIYNYGEDDIDLAKEGIRISKAYQSDNFSIVLRFSESDDYSGESIIPANSSLMITREKASEELKEDADVIGLRDEFSWTGDGYTLFLSDGPVSSGDDERIIDKVGWGDAQYFYTLATYVIEKDHILQRKALPDSKYEDMLEGGDHYNLAPKYNSLNNAFDFLLLPLNENEEEEEIIEEELSETLLISKISSDGFDDYLEIYNYGEEDIDLADEEIRVSKAYQSDNFSIVLRFSESDDYTGESIISANSSLMIVRDNANERLLSEADVIGHRSEFTWTGSGYTLYLSNGPVREDLDERIIDKVGWGEARFYQVNPASAIINDYALRRKPLEESSLADIVFGGDHVDLAPIYNSGNNSNDFILWPKNNILPVNYLSTLYLDYSPPGFIPFSDDISLSVPALKHLWHFDECYGDYSIDEITRLSDNPLKITGETPWYMDQFGCSRRMYYSDDDLVVDLPEKINANDFAISLLFKSEEAGGRFSINLSGDDPDRELDARFFTGAVEFNQGFPGYEFRNPYDGWPLSNEFNRLVLSFNNPSDNEQGYWTMEFNGQEEFSYLFSGLLYEFDQLKIGGDNSEVFIDELAIFDRGLSPSEREILAEPLPLLPSYPRSEQLAPKLKYAWLFDSPQGDVAKAAVGGQDLEIEGTSLVVNGYRGNALELDSYNEPFNLNLENPIEKNDLSISFWWKGSDSSSMRLKLSDDLENSFGLNLSKTGASYLFENYSGGLTSFSEDENWHHLALTYDSYRYKLKFYHNGHLVYEQKRKSFSPLVDDFSQLEIEGLNGKSYIDELKLWQGTLQKEQVMHEYSLITH